MATMVCPKCGLGIDTSVCERCGWDTTAGVFTWDGDPRCTLCKGPLFGGTCGWCRGLIPPKKGRS